MNEETLPVMNEEKIRSLMEEYGSGLLKLAYSYVRNWNTAEDLVQETFITIYSKYQFFDQKSTIKTWIYRIAINKCKDYLKSPKNRFLSYYSSHLVHSDNEKSVTDKLIDNEEAISISGSLMKLPVKYREVLLFYYYEELSIKEISELINVTEGNVKTRLLRGREKFKKQYELRRIEDVGTIEEFKNSIG
ncbi:sigma-70 family RNA polymerase sigma factor [Bacillus suaedaesalsae]|uniref:RNA polymerase sigma factor n=1 Tax=Bacillus suaedaesalsae TaxID=2810349 RepID=A0ABS2DMA1_9BACI|nr:sigma-70 family RNA polymerase sigma factor [Bacillus suaedaesalsae]MBM6619482.1 sigma-70 family RNA polymerase sigma factor [Bacillus suaedaesalsae]